MTKTFTWDVAGGLPVVLDDGSKYVYGAGLISQTSGANTYYYLSDGLGSTMKTVDATGTVVNGYTYDEYGKKTSSTGSQSNEFDFAGLARGPKPAPPPASPAQSPCPGRRRLFGRRAVRA